MEPEYDLDWFTATYFTSQSEKTTSLTTRVINFDIALKRRHNQ